ncbi:enolase [Ignicoccus hospitalis KIN4/I]|uniref:Enolase n=1 Tax=Ignicoccus hospitalis (strain KIN4/I / DSM 18386 / JCM 14125) TaxID=453591 RepID=A8AB84_IGNH4|nr:phosphopyruvate hydratase [Ignicoccus hospitalis]ABU82186.1 enolase [Ignicoccus hospitalis KIN4/I]
MRGRWILDSRGNPTVEVDVYTEGGFGRAAAPAGASKGSKEALELRDGGNAFMGKGVLKAVRNVNEVIGPSLVGMDSLDQKEIDMKMIELDGTENKSKLGANAIVATSMAVAKAAADSLSVPLYYHLGGALAQTLPTPLLNVINGGAHAGNELAIQEFMIVPWDFSSFSEALQAASEIYHYLKSYLKEKYGKSAINVGDEGGFAPPMRQTREALDALVNAIKKAGYEGRVALALDAAATHFYDQEKGVYRIDGKELDREGLLELYEELIRDYPIVSIEDPLHEEDWEGFKEAVKRLKIRVVGDDLLVTNPKLVKKAIEEGVANAVLVKVNQVGTVTEAYEVVDMAKRASWAAIVSHRSGETEDTFISHFAVGSGAPAIKAGAPARGERTAKYNELLRIEEELGRPKFARDAYFRT